MTTISAPARRPTAGRPPLALIPALLLALAGAWPTTAALGADPAPPPPAPAIPADPAKAPADDAAAQRARDERTYRSHIEFLANPFMEGRGPGTRGNEIAAEYIESNWKRIGLRPAFPAAGAGEGKADAAEYRQPFRAGTRPVVKSSTLGAGDGPDAPRFAEGTDYTTLGFSGTGDVTAPVVFAGYGVEKGGPDGAYSSFPKDEEKPLAGKVALVLRFEPMDAEGKSRWRKATDTLWSPASALTGKLNAIASRGAAAIVLVNPPGCSDPRARRLESPEGSGRWMRTLDVPVFMMSPEGADKLIKSLDPARDLAGLKATADESGGLVPLGERTAHLAAAVERQPRTTWNVAGVLPGKGALAHEYLVVGAHYDHVGYGYTGGSRTDEYGLVHPGADDNASGASGLLLAAEKMKARYDAAPEGASLRSIIFIAFSAEEMGLIGSREFVKNCPVSATDIAAMLNMDMIGRLRDEEIEAAGTGTAEGFNDFLKPFFAASGFKVKNDPGGRGPSDHATFYGAGVPVLHVFTGLHDEYHTPRDTVDLINVSGAVRVVDMVDDIAWALGGREDKLAFKSTDRPRRRRDDQSQRSDAPAADKPAGDAAPKPGDKPDPHADPNAPQGAGPGTGLGGVKVRFGIAPASYAEGEGGVPVGEVYPGTSAAEAGIQAGDRLLRWNGKEIGDVQEWMDLLAEHKPGDVVDVVLKRKAEEVTVKVTLKARDQSAR